MRWLLVLAGLWLVSSSKSQPATEGTSFQDPTNDGIDFVPDATDGILGNSAMNESFIDAWANAIEQHEGGRPGDRNERNNNPGNLKYFGQRGSLGPDPQDFAVFPDHETGMEALRRQLRKYVRDFPSYSILQIMTHYLGGDVNNPQVTGEGDPFAYAAAVANQVGSSIDATLQQLQGGLS